MGKSNSPAVHARIAIFGLAVLFVSGCAAFQSGDVRVSRNELRTMLSDKSIAPFADIRVAWKNFPYKTAINTIGEGSVSNPPKPRAVYVPPEDLARLRERAKDILAETGLYDAEKGSGTLELEMVSIHRWTYKELLRGFLVETPFILVVPASLKTGYYLTAGFDTASGPVKVEETARRKTVFHLLLIPLYPLFSPGARESSIINNMLWKASVDIYGKLKRPAPAPERAGDVQESAPAAQIAPPAASPAPDTAGEKVDEEAVETNN